MIAVGFNIMQALYIRFYCSTSQLHALIKYCFYLLLRVSFGLVGNSHNGAAAAYVLAAHFTLKTLTCTLLWIKDIYEKNTFAFPPRFHRAVRCGLNTALVKVRFSAAQ